MHDELLLTILATSIGKEGFVNGYIVETDGGFRGQIYGLGGLSKQRNFDSKQDAIRWLAAEAANFLRFDSMIRLDLSSENKEESVVVSPTDSEIALRATRIVECEELEWIDEFKFDRMVIVINKLDNEGNVASRLSLGIEKDDDRYSFSINNDSEDYEVEYKRAKEVIEVINGFISIMSEGGDETRFDLRLLAEDIGVRVVKGFNPEEQKLIRLIVML